MQAFKTLEVLAAMQKLPMPVFLAMYADKALPGALLDAESTEIDQLLQFLRSHIGTDPFELMVTVFPQLLQELVWHLGDTSSSAARKRCNTRANFCATRKQLFQKAGLHQWLF